MLQWTGEAGGSLLPLLHPHVRVPLHIAQQQVVGFNLLMTKIELC